MAARIKLNLTRIKPNLTKHFSRKVRPLCPSSCSGPAGVALLMVITAITILAYILGDVTFETQLNKTRAYQIMDKAQAQLNAESGLALALVQLTIYQQARNLLLKNKDQVKNLISEKDIEAMLLQPMMFPLEADKRMNILQRQAVEEFSKTNLLPGGLFLEITPERGFLNPNALAVDLPLDGDKRPDPGGPEDEESAPFLARQEFLAALNDSLKRAAENESEEDPGRWKNVDAERLILELTTYVSIMGRNDYVRRGVMELQNDYLNTNNALKFGLMASLSEMYALAGWSEEVVNLMIDQISVHNARAISINHITQNQLKFLLPDLNDEQIKEFFLYRDGDPLKPEGENADPHPFKSEDDFYNYFRNEVGMDNSDIAKIKARIEKLGLNFTVASDVFKILAKGSSNDVTYELEAYVALPIVEPDTKQDKNKNPPKNPDPGGGTSAKAVPQLDPPRVEELVVF